MTASHPNPQIPQIEVGDAMRAASPPADFVEAVRAASAEWGCFTIVGHGISRELERRFADQTRRFFALPRASKLQVERTAENARGFYDRELTKNRPDWKEVFDYGLLPGPDGEDQWPEGLDGFRQTMIEWQAACERVAFPLLRALAVGMGASAHALDAYFDRHTSFTRLNHYPICPAPAPPDAPLVPEQGALGVSHHTDAGALTLLWQDAVSGLQVQRDGVWTLVEIESGALAVNLGDMLQVWSNDHYVSPLHRVVASSERERFSAPFFFNPSADTVCRPILQPAHYRPVPWAEFRSLRAAGDYADLGEEVQLSHYRCDDAADAPESAR